MGCEGCELFPPPAQILHWLDQCLSELGIWPQGTSRQIFRDFIAHTFSAIESPSLGHSSALTTTNLWHLRAEFCTVVRERLGATASAAADRIMAASITCYAAKLHLNKAKSIVNPKRGANKGYAPTFERVTRFDGRAWQAARASDLCGALRPDKPWLDGCRRLIFVSDMGDAFSRDGDFGFWQTRSLHQFDQPRVKTMSGYG